MQDRYVTNFSGILFSLKSDLNLLYTVLAAQGLKVFHFIQPDRIPFSGDELPCLSFKICQCLATN